MPLPQLDASRPLRGEHAKHRPARKRRSPLSTMCLHTAWHSVLARGRIETPRPRVGRRVRLNEARVDPGGSLWIGSMQNNVNPDSSGCAIDGKHSVLFRLDPDASVSVHKTDIGIANTLAWSPDRRRLYFSDTPANTIWAYDYDPPTRSIKNERPFLQDFARGRPDRPSMPKVVSGIAGIPAGALCASLPMAVLIVWSKCRCRTLRHAPSAAAI